MLPHPATVRHDLPLREAIDIITENRISGLCVIDEQGNLVGILSELDCLRAILGAVYNKSGIGIVADYMATENLVVAHPDEDIVDVAQDMLMNNKRSRPVVENGRLVGQITCRALLKAVQEFQERRA
jgi:CBS domain-containing protein